ncbi:hypothetical protein [Streptomyces sp. NPDC005573]|uniref:hypothetical protein n=1 Tax=Streptomyces sp. NPDC005573 TaxID=3156890 RepID=UPI0033A08821
MPATLIASQPVSALQAAEIISVSDLSNAERAVALYASDLPDSYSYGGRADDARLDAWVVQGATRMGLESLYRTAALHSGYGKSRAGKYLSSEQKRAEAERFPSRVRIRRSGELAALVTMRVGVTDVARERGKRVEFDGGCPKCHGAGRVWGMWAVDTDAEWFEEGYRSCWVCGEPSGAGATSVGFIEVAA